MAIMLVNVIKLKRILITVHNFENHDKTIKHTIYSKTMHNLFVVHCTRFNDVSVLRN